MSNAFRQLMDFEQWSELASRDPEAFEHLRRKLIEAQIGAASQRSRERLRGLQWRIDQIREIAPTPMAACISLSNMMWESFAGEGGLVQALNAPRTSKEKPDGSGQLLLFPARRK